MDRKKMIHDFWQWRLNARGKKESRAFNLIKELADLHMMKESLRSIYRVVENPFETELALDEWCRQALSLDSAYLGKMVKCLRQHWEGVLGFWKYDSLTSAGMEGFNNKVRTMIRQAYGFRDEEYMRLKIFDLPTRRVNDGI